MSRYLSAADWMAEFKAAGCSPSVMAKSLGISVRGVQARLADLRQKGADLPTHDARKPAWAYHRIRRHEFPNGVAIVYSDAHYGASGSGRTVAFLALLELCKELKPKAVIANGDLIDGASISRFPTQGWSKSPTMTEEIGELQVRQAEIRKAARGAELFRTVGNHDVRIDRTLKANADQFEGLKGFRMADYLPDWPESWVVKINDTFVKHRIRGGVHAAWNNAIHSGGNIVTGHLHTMGAKMIRGYRDRPAWGVETGTLSNPSIDEPDDGGTSAFEYAEDNPTNWASGFAVLTYCKGALLPPEFCWVIDGKAWFRGKVVT